MKKLLLTQIGLLTCIVGCSANHLNAGMVGHRFVEEIEIEGRIIEVFRSTDDPLNYRAAKKPDGKWEKDAALNLHRIMLEAIEKVSDCAIDGRYVSYGNLTSIARVFCS